MKVLHVVSHFELGGAELYALDLAEIPSDDVKSAIFVVTPGSRSAFSDALYERMLLAKVKIYHGSRLPAKLGGVLFSAELLVKAVRRFDPDIVQLHTELPEFIYTLASLASRRVKCARVVRTLHNTNVWPAWKAIGAICDYFLKDALLVAVSGVAGEDFLRRQRAVKPNNKRPLKVIYNCIDPPRTTRQKGSKSFRSRAIRVLFAGRFTEQKGVDLVPSVLKLINLPESIKGEIKVAGVGPLAGTLLQLQSSPPKDWSVQVVPPIPNISEILADYDLLFFPSRFEGFGRLAAEAILARLPVVAFEIEPLREMFGPDYAWLASIEGDMVENFAASVENILSEYDQACESIEQSRMRLIKTVSRKEIYRKYIEAYTSILSR